MECSLHSSQIPRACRVGSLSLGLVIFALTGCGGEGEVGRFGEPPTREWPHEMICPEPVRALCGEKRLYLTTTINVAQPGGFQTLSFSDGDELVVLCKWPESAPRMSCEELGPAGATIIGEAASYGVTPPDRG